MYINFCHTIQMCKTNTSLVQKSFVCDKKRYLTEILAYLLHHVKRYKSKNSIAWHYTTQTSTIYLQSVR